MAELARQDSGLSHSNETCWKSVAVFSLTIAELVGSLDQSQDRSRAWARARSWILGNSGDDLKAWGKLIERGEHVPGHPQAGFVKIAFIHAFQSLIQGRGYTATQKAVSPIDGIPTPTPASPGA